MKVTTEEYVKNYYEILNSNYPLFIKYLDFMNTVAGYIVNMHIDLSNSYDVLASHEYECRLDRYATIELTGKILGSINNDYEKLFYSELKKGNIKFSPFKRTITSTTKKKNKIRIKIYETHTIEDVLKLVHEMLHFIHLKNYDCEISDEDFYFYSEMYAVIGDFYGIFYLLENNILTNDVNTYLKDLFIGLTAKSDTTISNGIFLFTYKSVNNIKDDLVKKYVKEKQFPEEYADLGLVLNNIKEFTFHEDSQYLFALPFSYIISKMMISDDKYKEILVNCLSKVKDNGSNSIIYELGLDKIFSNEEFLYTIITDFYSVIENAYEEKEIGYQKKIGDLW